MKTNRKSIRSLLVILLVAQSINASMFYGLKYTQAKLADWIYQNTTAQISFFQPKGGLNHQTTKSLQIEYSVLKVPAVKTTAVKK